MKDKQTIYLTKYYSKSYSTIMKSLGLPFSFTFIFDLKNIRIFTHCFFFENKHTVSRYCNIVSTTARTISVAPNAIPV